MAYWAIRNSEMLRAVTHQQVIDWALYLKAPVSKGGAGLKSSSVGNKLSALSSLYAHLKNHGLVPSNPVKDVPRPGTRSMQGSTPAFSPLEARLVMDAPNPKNVDGLRDRALLAVGFYSGARVSEICKLRIRDYYTDSGYKSLWFHRKGDKEGGLAINPQCVNRIEAYLDASGHREDKDAPLFPARRNNRHQQGERHLHRSAVNHLLRNHIIRADLDPTKYTPHSMRATFITTAFANGAVLEDVQDSVGHSSPEITKGYNRAIFTPERSASFKCDY